MQRLDKPGVIGHFDGSFKISLEVCPCANPLEIFRIERQGQFKGTERRPLVLISAPCFHGYRIHRLANKRNFLELLTVEERSEIDRKLRVPA